MRHYLFAYLLHVSSLHASDAHSTGRGKSSAISCLDSRKYVFTFFSTLYARLTISRPIPSAKYYTPLHCPTDSLTLLCSALYGQKLSMHVRSPRLLFPRRRVDVYLFRHHAQQATSEKKRISTVSRRPRAYTGNTQQRSVSPFPPPSPQHAAILFAFCFYLTLSMTHRSPTYLVHPPRTSRSYSHT